MRIVQYAKPGGMQLLSQSTCALELARAVDVVDRRPHFRGDESERPPARQPGMAVLKLRNRVRLQDVDAGDDRCKPDRMMRERPQDRIAFVRAANAQVVARREHGCDMSD